MFYRKKYLNQLLNHEASSQLGAGGKPDEDDGLDAVE
jgi:hypothetical protein